MAPVSYLSTVMWDTRDDGRSAPLVASTKDGKLVCRGDHQDSQWCPDVRTAMSASLDSASIFMDMKAFEIHNIVVPVTPSEGVMARVFLEPITEDVLKVFLEEPKDMTAAIPPKLGIDGIELGLICPGDGRMQIRTMITNWMKPTVGCDQVNLQCKSLRHRPLRQAEMLKEWRTIPQKAVAHFWCLYWYEKCAFCFKEEGTAQFDSDLIPPR